MTGPPTLLALDAAGRACSVAVCRGAEVLGRRFEPMSRGQSERLLPMVREVMDEARVDFADLDGLAVTRGPGAFTGVRIGLAAARGLALARNLPLVGVTCFEAVAAAVEAALPPAEFAGHSLVVLLDAKRADLYVQAFCGRRPLDAPRALRPEQLSAALPEGPLLIAGDAVGQAEPALRAAGRVLARAPVEAVDAVAVARCAARRPLPPPGDDLPAALYLRPPDVTRPRPRLAVP